MIDEHDELSAAQVLIEADFAKAVVGCASSVVITRRLQQNASYVDTINSPSIATAAQRRGSERSSWPASAAAMDITQLP